MGRVAGFLQAAQLPHSTIAFNTCPVLVGCLLLTIQKPGFPDLNHAPRAMQAFGTLVLESVAKASTQPTLLRNGDRLYRGREVSSRRHPVPQFIQVVSQLRIEVLN